jgi:hypothetical protein
MRLVKLRKWIAQGWNVAEVVSNILLLAVVMIHLTARYKQNNAVFVSAAACTAILLWSKLFYYMMPFATTGTSLMVHLKSYSTCKPIVCGSLQGDFPVEQAALVHITLCPILFMEIQCSRIA